MQRIDVLFGDDPNRPTAWARITWFITPWPHPPQPLPSEQPNKDGETNEPTDDKMKEQADGAKVHRPIRMFTSCNLVSLKVPVLYNGLHALFTCNVQKRDADADQPSFFKKLFTSQSHPSEQPKKDGETKKPTDDKAVPEQADAKTTEPPDGAKVRMQTYNAYQKIK